MQTPSTGGVRFAPSPTGRFHVGNLRTAWISWHLAQQFKLPWIIRFEDIDLPRVLPGARDQQRTDLVTLGMNADHEFLQSDFRNRHWDLFKKAVSSKQIYPCDCSRKEVQAALATMASAPHSEPATYSGRCRNIANRKLEATETLAWRFKMPNDTGKDDFIVARTSKEIIDGLPTQSSFVPAYHWACAIDDHDGNYDLLVRSSDLRPSLQPQRAIQEWLGRKKPIATFHTSLITQNDGHRLEKRTAGVTLPELQAQGVSPGQLIALFKNSFSQVPTKFLDSASFGEQNETLSLRQLGLYSTKA